MPDDVLFLACFMGGVLFTWSVFWGWNRALKRNAAFWYQQYRARDDAFARISEANATTTDAP